MSKPLSNTQLIICGEEQLPDQKSLVEAHWIAIKLQNGVDRATTTGKAY